MAYPEQVLQGKLFNMTDQAGHAVIIGAEVVRHNAFGQELENLLKFLDTTVVDHRFYTFISYVLVHFA